MNQVEKQKAQCFFATAATPPKNQEIAQNLASFINKLTFCAKYKHHVQYIHFCTKHMGFTCYKFQSYPPPVFLNYKKLQRKSSNFAQQEGGEILGLFGSD